LDFGGLPNGGPVLWSTHDGGTTWQRQTAPDLNRDGPIFDLEAANGTVYFMAIHRAQTVAVESSPVGRDAWQVDRTPTLALPAGGAEPGGSIVLQGGNGWLVEGNDRGITGSAVLEGNGVWKSWTPPCQSVGDGYTVPAASNSSDLVAVCVIGGYASPLTRDAPPGATLGSSWLYMSWNGGLSFHYGAEVSGRGYFNEVLAAPTASTIVTTRGTTSQQLVASFDGGRQWDVVYRADFFYVGFTSPTQGVTLAQQSSSTPGRTLMVMTFDGGHHWSVVHF
jgi:hypothetical protein